MERVEIRRVPKFYDSGWNDRVDKLPFNVNGKKDINYKDGYSDCDEAIKDGTIKETPDSYI